MTDALTIDRPIEGRISRYRDKAVEQHGPERFLSDLDQLLAVQGVETVRWEQFTPYFNDGDACEFGTGEVRVKLAERFGVDEYGGDYADGYITSYSLWSYGEVDEEPKRYLDKDGIPTDSYLYNSPNPAYHAWSAKKYDESNKVFSLNGQDTTEIYAALSAFESNMANFESVLLNNFGDPALVTATTDGFSVEYYEHD